MNKIAIASIIILLLVVFVVLNNMQSSSPLPPPLPPPPLPPLVPVAGCVADATAPGYSFCQGKDSNLGDLTTQASLANNVPGLAGFCNSLNNCAGFNTNGFIKGSILPQAQWTTWSGPPTQGLY